MIAEAKLEEDRRRINYLRLSVTDRCNLRCIYCMPEAGISYMPHGEILSYEEMLRIVDLSVQCGIRKVRLTGGEPFVRKGFIRFLERLSKMETLDEITLTTNGVFLKEYAAAIRECGICRINVSLDSLQPAKFSRITGRSYYETVWDGIREAEHLGFNPIKINVVAMRGVNDDEILDFARLTLEKPFHIRFIELMPVGENNSWRPDKFISIGEILGRIETLGNLVPVESNPNDGPAERFALEGGRGEIGLIGALSHHFCEKCNRLRLTAEGHLRGCLFSDQEIDLKAPLRAGRRDDHLLGLIKFAMANKPMGHERMARGPRKCVRQMSSIGG
jgi:cyclic pyranopterin phosphate synthase